MNRTRSPLWVDSLVPYAFENFQLDAASTRVVENRLQAC
jgi:hypothetical protein